MEEYQKHISFAEKTVAVVLGALLLLTLVTQLFFNGNVLHLLILLAVCTAVYAWLVFLPETYELRDDSLTVVRLFGRKTVRIPCADILQIDVNGTFREFKKEADSAEAILRYRSGEDGRTRTIACHPKNLIGFVKSLQEKCPNLVKEPN